MRTLCVDACELALDLDLPPETPLVADSTATGAVPVVPPSADLLSSSAWRHNASRSRASGLMQGLRIAVGSLADTSDPMSGDVPSSAAPGLTRRGLLAGVRWATR